MRFLSSILKLLRIRRSTDIVNISGQSLQSLVPDFHEYPWGDDTTWLACDEIGHVAAFTLAIDGPIPIDALRATLPTLAKLSAIIADMPVTEPVDNRIHGYPEAERGFYVFDWGEQPMRQKPQRHYVRLNTPRVPVTMHALPELLRHAAASAQFTRVRFAEVNSLDPRTHFACYVP